MAEVADGLLLAGGGAAGAVFRFLVVFVTAADAAVGAVAVGGPIAPLVLQRLSIGEGGFKRGALGACAAAGAGLIIDGCIGAGSCILQIGILGNLCRVVMTAGRAVFGFADVADGAVGAVGSAAGAVFRFLVLSVIAADAAVSAAAVGGPFAPSVALSFSMGEGGFKRGALGACAADGAGLVIDGGFRAGGRGLQILIFGNLCRVAVGGKLAVFGVAEVADGLLLAGGGAAGAGFGFLVLSIIAADAAVGAAAVGDPFAPSVTQRRDSKGGVDPILRACAADRAGFVVSSLALAGRRRDHIFLILDFFRKSVRNQNSVFLAADRADGQMLAVGGAAGAVFIHSGQCGVAGRHRAGVGGAGTNLGGGAVHGQLPVGEVLVIGCVLGGVGEGFAGEIGGGGAFLYVHQGQGHSLLFRKPDIFAVGQDDLSGGCHQRGAGFVIACPDAVVAGDGGIHCAGACVAGGQDDGAAGDLVGVAFGIGIHKETAIRSRFAGYVGAGKVQGAAVGHVEGIFGRQIDRAALEGGGALGRNDTVCVGAAVDFAAGHFKAEGELGTKDVAGQMQLTAGHLAVCVGDQYIISAVFEGHFRTGELGVAHGINTVDGGGAVFVGNVDLAAGESHCAGAVRQINASIGGIDVQLAAGNRQLAVGACGKPNACSGIEGHLGGVGDFQL